MTATRPAGLKIFASRDLWYVTHRPSGTPILRSLRERPTAEYLASPEFRQLLDQTVGGDAFPSQQLRATKRRNSRKKKDGPLVGVYLLMQGRKIVYIGSSVNMPLRVSLHRSNGRPFDEAFYIGTKEDQRLELEAILIMKIQPPQNKRYRNPHGSFARVESEKSLAAPVAERESQDVAHLLRDAEYGEWAT